MRILITGSDGFLGGTVGRFAAHAGHEVFGIGRASLPARGWLGGYAQADVLSADLSNVVRDFDPHLLFNATGAAFCARPPSTRRLKTCAHPSLASRPCSTPRAARAGAFLDALPAAS